MTNKSETRENGFELLDSLSFNYLGKKKVTREMRRYSDYFWEVNFVIGPDFKGVDDDKDKIYKAIAEVLPNFTLVEYRIGSDFNGLVYSSRIGDSQDTGEHIDERAKKLLKLLSSDEIKRAIKAYIELDSAKKVLEKVIPNIQELFFSYIMSKPNLPEKLLERLDLIFGQSNAQKILTTFKARQTTFRVNTLKNDRVEVLQTLQQKGFKVKRVPWFSDAFILENKSQLELTKTDLFVQGKIYLQSLASMVPVIVLDPKPGEKVLDLTSAPGSKTSQMAMMMGKVGELVANELDKIRFEKQIGRAHV